MTSHLLFVDDCFLFSRATDTEAQTMRSILTCYGEAFDQEINLQKFEVSFSRNLLPDTRNTTSSILGVNVSLGTGKYLGVPSMLGRSKRAMFSFTKDRVWRSI